MLKQLLPPPPCLAAGAGAGAPDVGGGALSVGSFKWRKEVGEHRGATPHVTRSHHQIPPSLATINVGKPLEKMDK